MLLARAERVGRRAVGALISARGILGFGLLEQVVLSGAAFVLTAYLARHFAIEAMGAYGVATAIAIFLEASLFLMLGDGVPAMAAKLPSRAWPSLYGALFVISLVISLVMATVTLVAGSVVIAYGGATGWPLVGVALSYPVTRVYGFLRRQCYFFGLRRRAAVGALVYAFALAAATTLFERAALLTPTTAFACLAIAAVAASVAIVAPGIALRRPSARLLGWCAHRLRRDGLWLFGTSLLSWAGNMGLVPFVGLTADLSAAAGLRVVQTIVSPISQLMSVLISHLLPRTTLRLARENPAAHLGIINEVVATLLTVSISVALLMTLLAHPFLAAFGKNYTSIATWVIALGCIGFALESSKMAFNILLLYRRKAQVILVGQVVACTVSFAFAYLLYPTAGLAGLVFASVAGNLSNTVLVTVYAVRLARAFR